MKILKKNIVILATSVCVMLLCFLLLMTNGLGINLAYAAQSEDDYSIFRFNQVTGGWSIALEDKTVTSVKIPANHPIDGQPITEIALNGFAGVQSLEEVTIPETVTKINNSAFNNCANLRAVNFIVGWDEEQNLELGIRQIGSMAFGACSSLTSITIPKTATGNINTLAFRNSPTKINDRTESITSLSGFQGTIVPYGVTDIIFIEWDNGFAIDDYQGTGDINSPLTIPATHNGQIVECILPDAFSGCYFSEINFSEDFISNDQTIYLWDNAFANVKTAEITLPSFVVIDENSANTFYNSNITTITIAQELDLIPEGMFEQCDGLTTILFNGIANVLSDSISYIGDRAFAETTSLARTNETCLFIPASVTAAGFEIFHGWTSEQFIKIGFDVDPVEQGWHSNWKGSGTPTILRNSYTITYTLNGGTNHSANPASYTGEQNITLQDPAYANCVFLGWYNENNLKVVIIFKDTTGNIQLYARWWCPIAYALDGGTNHSNNPTSYTTGNIIILNDATRTGYNFEGWFYNALFTGNPIDRIEAGTTGALTLYAKWIEIDYTITYNVNGGDELNPDSYRVYYDSPYTLSVPTRSGYNFLGWFGLFNGMERQYTDSEGYSLDDWTEVNDKTLYAKWGIITYIVTYNLNDGINNSENPATYTVNDEITLKEPTRQYYTFGGWYTSSSFTSSSQITVISGTENRVLYAKWTSTSYYISYQCWIEGNSKRPAAWYSMQPSNMPLIVGWNTYTAVNGKTLMTTVPTGYTDLEGWYDNPNFTGTKYTSIPVGSTGNKIFYGKVRLVGYVANFHVDYDVETGKAATGICCLYTVLDALELNHSSSGFYGWFRDPAFRFRITSWPVGSTGDLDLYGSRRIFVFSTNNSEDFSASDDESITTDSDLVSRQLLYIVNTESYLLPANDSSFENKPLEVAFFEDVNGDDDEVSGYDNTSLQENTAEVLLLL